jgi:hypothetical protein
LREDICRGKKAGFGAAVVSLGLGYAAVSIAGGVLTAAGLARVLIGGRQKSRRLAICEPDAGRGAVLGGAAANSRHGVG